MMKAVIVMTDFTVSLASFCPVPSLIVLKESEFEPVENIVFAFDLKQVTRSTPVSEIGWWLESREQSYWCFYL